MRWTELFREAWTSGRTQPVSFFLIMAVAVAMCASTVLTVGRTAASESQLIETVTAEGSQRIVVTDAKSQDAISVNTVSLLQGVPAVASVVAGSQPVDATNTALGAQSNRVSAWQLFGDISEVANVVRGRLPQPGEAIVSSSALERLGLDEPIGSLSTYEGRQFPIVGQFEPREGGADFAEGAVVRSDGTEPLTSLRVMVEEYGQVPAVQELALGLITPPDPSAISVVSPVSLAQLQVQLVGDLGANNRGLVALVLGSGAVLIGAVCLSDVLLRRKEIGRRRALGIVKRDIVILLILRTLFPGAIGALAGTLLAGLASVALGSVVPFNFLVGVSVLAFVASGASACLPAAVAAIQDPVRILRTP